MTLLQLIKEIKIDFTQCLVRLDTGSTLDHQFEISPKEFLSFSKQDFKLKDKRGSINALTNAKRAIDCQTDRIFHCLGLDPNNFPSIVEDFITRVDHPIKKDLPVRLKFLQALGFAPAEIIGKARLLRNKLEHYYKTPTDDEISNAIELAELFILATDNKLKSIWDFSITDTEKYGKSDGHLWNSIYITYAYDKNNFEIRGYIGTDNRKNSIIGNNEIEFYYLLKIATSFDYKEDVCEEIKNLLLYIGHPIPQKNIRISVE